MAPHPGLEHETIPALESLMVWNGTHQPPTHLLDLAKTAAPGRDISPNQWATLIAVRVTWAILSDHADLVPALAQARGLLITMRTAGHMCTGGAGYSNESLCPDPHTRIWMHAMGAILRAGVRAKDEALTTLAVGFWGDHVALCLAHWTPMGVRVAAFRCDPPKDGGMIQPNWALDSLLVAEVVGIRAPDQYFGSRNDTALQVMRQSRALYPKILEAAKAARPVLRIPLLRRDGAVAGSQGYISALYHDEAANGRMSWVWVANDGTIMKSDNTLATLPPGVTISASLMVGTSGLSVELSPYAATLLPLLGFRWNSPTAEEPTTPTTTSTTTPVTPTTPPITTTPDVAPDTLTVFPAVAANWSQRLNVLVLDKIDRAIRNGLVSRLRTGAPFEPGRLASMADMISRFGVNAQSPQARDIATLVTEMKTYDGGNLK